MRVQNAPSGQGVAAYWALVGQRCAQRKRLLRPFSAAALLALAAAWVVYWTSAKPVTLDVMLLASVAALVVALAPWLVSESRLSRADYLSLPEAKGLDGVCRCVQCGHRGVHRRTPYKTQTTLADCSKCGFALWRE